MDEPFANYAEAEEAARRKTCETGDLHIAVWEIGQESPLASLLQGNQGIGKSADSRMEPLSNIGPDFVLTGDEANKEFEITELGRESRSAETASRNKNVSGAVDSGIRVEGEGSASSR